MIGEMMSELRSQFSERIRNPILGPFTGAWMVWNWRLLAVLLLSDLPIEQRIGSIEENYLCISNLVVEPLVFAVFYALLLPWVNLGVQYLQAGVNLRRRKHKIDNDTNVLRASVARAQAQADLNRILAKDRVTQEQRSEIDRLTGQLAEQQEKSDARIAAYEAELERRRAKFDAMSGDDKVKADQARLELEETRERLEQERRRALEEADRFRSRLKQREFELEARLADDRLGRSAFTDEDIVRLLETRRFRLFHNPRIGPERSKLIVFRPDGKIGEGRNNNESSWQVNRGRLELLQSDGSVHSRFAYLPDSQIFVHTGDEDTKSARGQYIIPVGESAASA